MVYEYHGDVSNSMKNIIFQRYKNNDLIIRYHHTLTHLIYFFRKITRVMPIKLNLQIQMNDNELLPNEILDLSVLLNSPFITIEELYFIKTYLTINEIIFLSTYQLKTQTFNLSSSDNTQWIAPQSPSEIVKVNEIKFAKLVLISCKLSDDHIKQLQPCIPHLERLDLSDNNNITSLSMTHISECIAQAAERNINHLKELKLE